MPEFSKVYWLICPKCKYSYYAGEQLIRSHEPAICPKCRTEFDHKTNQKPRFDPLQNII